MADPTNPFDYLNRFKDGAAPVAKPSDPMASTLDAMRKDDLRTIMRDAGDPNKTADVSKLARETGLPPALIEDRVDEVRRDLAAGKLTDVLSRDPALSKWAANNPRSVAAAQGDHEALASFGSAWDILKDPVMAFAKAWDRFDAADRGSNTSHAGVPLMAGVAALMGDGDVRLAAPDIISKSPAAAKSGALSIGAGVLGYLRGAAEDEGWSSAAGVLKSGSDALDAKAKAAMPKTGNWMKDQVLGGVSNVPSAAASLGLGVAGRAAGLSVRAASMSASALGGVAQGGQSYNTARAQGVSPRNAFFYANVDAATEMAGEYFGTAKFLRLTDAGASVITRFLKSQVPEIAGESATTIAQSLSAWMMLPENSDKTLEEWASTLPEDLAATAVQTLVASGITNVTVSAFEKGLDAYGERLRRESGSTLAARSKAGLQAFREQAFFDKVGKAVQSSKLRERDPVAFEQMVKHMAEGSEATAAYIPCAVEQNSFSQSQVYE